MSKFLNDNQQSVATSIIAEPVHIWTLSFVLLCSANLIMFMSTQMLFPSLPGYLLIIGGAPSDVGYVMGAYTIGATIIRPISGWLVDKYGRKRLMIVGMLLMLGISFLYNHVRLINLMVLVRLLHGFAFGLASTALSTIVVDNLPKSRLTEGMGYFGLTTSLSMALAPLIGFWLVGKSGYSTLFMGVCLFITLAFGASLLVRSSGVPSNTEVISITSLWDSLVEKTALPASGVMFFLALVYGAVLSFIPLYAAESGITNIGLFFTSLALTMLISRPISGRWADQGGTNIVLFLGHLFIFAGMIITSLSDNISDFLWAGAFIGLGFGFCLPTLQALSVSNAPANRRGAATGTFFAVFDLGIGLGMIIWGHVVAATSYQTMYHITLIPVVLAIVVCYRTVMLRSKP
ncbi:MAG: MFS transporter [Syntrophomonadaceae bacterium]